jgi:crotonobetainyl-CoA:carnitine CoA-transferase CaiB-like acyl-CoA transferase
VSASRTPSDILDEFLTLGGVSAVLGSAQIAGADPVLPTPLRIGDLGAAAIAAAAVQAARLLEARTGQTQDVRVDVDAAAAAMRSWTYLDVTSAPPRAAVSDRQQFFRTRDDRWIFLHRRAAHHAARQDRVLGCGSSDREVADAVQRCDGAELEEAIVAEAACAALVRSRAEWAAHEQGRAVAAMPLFEITKIGDSDPIPAGRGERPLGGLRVLDLTHVLAGPTCARTLAEHGADVLRVGMDSHSDSSPMTLDTGHGKRSCVLDLKSDAGAQALAGLIQGCDVFSQGYRPGAMDHLGFSPERLAQLRPGVVYVSLSAFGTQGPWCRRRGYDSVVQSVSGIADEVSVDGEPRFLPVSSLDYTTGYLAAFLVMVALERRAREGGSYHVSVSLAQTGRYLDELGRIDPETAASRLPELPPERLNELTTTSRTSIGLLRHLAPIARMSRTPPRWERPTAPMDQDPPSW